MSTMDTFQARLSSALEATVNAFNRCGDPDEAVAKTASDFGFTPAGTQRLLETFNRARTIYHFSTATDKTAEFKLAEPERVQQLMYAEPTPAAKTASAAELVSLSASYDTSEHDYTKEPFVGFNVKQAELDHVLTTEQLYSQIQLQRGAFTSAKSAAEDRRNLAQYRADQYLEKLARSLFLAGADKLPHLLAQVKEACQHEDELKVIPNQLPAYFGRGQYPAQLPTTKSAHVIDTTAIEPYLTLARAAVGELQKVATAEAELATLASESAEFEGTVEREFYGKQAESDDFLLVKTAAPPATPVPPTAGKPKSDSGKADALKFPAKVLDRGLTSAFDADLYRVMEGGEIERKNKELTSAITNLKRQTLLEDVMSRDPVLSQADPNAVAAAYQAILNVAPESALVRPVVVAMLRQQVQAQDAWSPYDAEQLARFSIMRRNATSGGPVPKAPDGTK